MTGVSGSGKSSLVSQALVELVAAHLGHEPPADEDEGEELERDAAVDRRRAHRRRAWRRITPAGARRPEADRPHAALEPGHLHRPVRPRAQAVRRDAGGAGAPLRRRALLVQRRQGPLRDLRGRGLRDASSCCSCRACTRRARPATARATTRRRWRSRTASKNIAEVLGMTVDAACEFFADEPHVRALARRAARGRPRLPAPGPAGDRAVRRRGAAHQARHRAAARRSAATRSTCSTSRRPACIRPTSSKLMAQLRRAGRRRQHRDRGRARHARGRRAATG